VILDDRGHPIRTKRPAVPVRKPPARIAARYDAAQTGTENQRHWAAADFLSASAAGDRATRSTLRARARYEVANNSYAAGIVSTLANYVVGTGARLQMLTEDVDLNTSVETAFSAWGRAVGLPDKLRLMRAAQCESGEVFGLITNNPRVRHPVKLDLRLVEADQVEAPLAGYPFDSRIIEGIVFDEKLLEPVGYCLLRRHPGDTRPWVGMGLEYDIIDAENVIHLFRATRPGQIRGIPELTPGLPLFAILRRYTMAVLGAAEIAALIGGTIESTAPADADAAEVDPMETFEMDRGTWLTMPDGWKASQFKAEQPTSAYGEFKHEVLNECGRAVGMPFNLIAANSSAYNYASGRLDHQAFFKGVRIDQQHLESVVLDRLLAAYLWEAELLGEVSLGTFGFDEELPHQWFWDGIEHVDPVKESTADEIDLRTNATTLAEIYGNRGKDWETELRQSAKEKATWMALCNEFGLPTGTAPPRPAGTAMDEDGGAPADDTSGDNQGETP